MATSREQLARNLAEIEAAERQASALPLLDAQYPMQESTLQLGDAAAGLGAAGMAWALGPVAGLAAGAMGILARKQERTQLAILAEKEQADRAYLDQAAEDIYAGAGDIYNSTLEAAQEDIDRKQLDNNMNAVNRAREAYQNASTFEQKQSALASLSNAVAKMEDQGLSDIENRTRQIYDYEQEVARKTISDEFKAGNREIEKLRSIKSGYIADRDKTLALVREHAQDDGSLSDIGRGALIDQIGVVARSNNAAAQIIGAVLGGAVGLLGGPIGVGAGVGTGGKVASGIDAAMLDQLADLSDGELLRIYNAQIDSAIAESDRITEQMLPYQRKQAEALGLDPELFGRGEEFPLTKRQQENLNWSRGFGPRPKRPTNGDGPAYPKLMKNPDATNREMDDARLELRKSMPDPSPTLKAL